MYGRYFYIFPEWLRVAETVENMSKAKYITFHTTRLSVGEEDALDEYCVRGFRLRKTVHQQGTQISYGVCTYTWEKVGRNHEFMHNT